MCILLIGPSAFPSSSPSPYLDFLGYKQESHLPRPLTLTPSQPGVDHVPRAAFFAAVAFLRIATVSGL
jgi:hypothetical protein